MGNTIPSTLIRGIASVLVDMTRFTVMERTGNNSIMSGTDIEGTTPYAFKPMTFQELSADCNRGKKKNRSNLPVPEPRSGHQVVCDDGNMYSFGGYCLSSSSANWPAHLSHGGHRLFQELWCYNFADSQWKLLPTLGAVPKELASHSAVLYGNYLVVFGGTGVPFGSCSSNQMNICDLRTLEWSSIETEGTPPTPHYGQGVVMDTLNKAFYVTGGTTGYDYSMDIHKLDMNTFVWETLYIASSGILHFDEPRPRYRHEVALYDNTIYIMGGGTATEAYDLVNVHTFDLRTRQWTKIVTTPYRKGKEPTSTEVYPAPRKCQESVQIGDDVLIFGGYDSTDIFMDLWKLHLPSMTWKFVPVSMPVPLYFHSACLTNAGCLYIFGGVTNVKNNTRTNKVFKIWLKVPKLKEMCWEALLHYNKSIKYQPHSAILDMGIPKEFVTRVHPAPPCGKGSSISEQW